MLCRGQQQGRRGDARLSLSQRRLFLGPLSEIQVPWEVLEGYLGPVRTGQPPLLRSTRVTATGQQAYSADGFERLEPVTAVVAGEARMWTERRLEFIVRQRSGAARTVLARWYAGNPKRAPARPTTERRRKRFAGLTLTIIREGRRRRSHLTPLSRVQRRILTLLNLRLDL